MTKEEIINALNLKINELKEEKANDYIDGTIDGLIIAIKTIEG